MNSGMYYRYVSTLQTVPVPGTWFWALHATATTVIPHDLILGGSSCVPCSGCMHHQTLTHVLQKTNNGLPATYASKLRSFCLN